MTTRDDEALSPAELEMLGGQNDPLTPAQIAANSQATRDWLDARDPGFLLRESDDPLEGLAGAVMALERAAGENGEITAAARIIGGDGLAEDLDIDVRSHINSLRGLLAAIGVELPTRARR